MSTPTPVELGLDTEPLAAGPNDPPSTHLRMRLDTQLRALLSHEPGTRAGSDPEQLHQMRVAVRRMRTVLKQAGAPFGAATEELRTDLRWLGDALGEVRDYDVLIGHLRQVVADFDEHDQAAAERLIAVFGSQRAHAKRRLNRKFDTARYRRLLESTAELITRAEPLPDDESAATPDDRVTLVRALRKPHKKLRKTLAALPQHPDDDDLHALRIRGKRLRYAAELALPAAGKKSAKRIKSLIKAAKRLQDTLGEHQDAVVVTQRMRQLARDDADGEIGFIAGRIAEHELARRAHARNDWARAAAKVDAAARAVL